MLVSFHKQGRGHETDLDSLVPICPTWGYNLTGLQEHRCPECGNPFDPVALLKGQLHEGTIRSVGLIGPLIVQPVAASMFGAVIAVYLLSIGLIGLLVVAFLFLWFLLRNGERVKRRVSDSLRRRPADRKLVFRVIDSGGVVTLLILQLIPVGLFWAAVILLLWKYPPKLFPF